MPGLDGRTGQLGADGLEQPWPLGRGQGARGYNSTSYAPTSYVVPLAQRINSEFLEALLYPLQMLWLGTVNRSLFLRMHHVHSSFFLFPLFLG